VLVPPGTSDPYVILGLVSEKTAANKDMKNLVELEQNNLTIGKLQHTQVVDNNLNPVWNEMFEL